MLHAWPGSGILPSRCGGEDEARHFLFRPHAMLEDRRPVDVVIQNEIGAELVLDVLQGLKYGSAA